MSALASERGNGIAPTDGPATPETIGLFGMVLEAADPAASERFYRDVIGLPGRRQRARADPANVALDGGPATDAE